MVQEPFELERYFAEHEFSSKYLLCASDCESYSIGDLLALEPGASVAFLTHWLGYTESSGAPWLRQEIARIAHPCCKRTLVCGADGAAKRLGRGGERGNVFVRALVASDMGLLPSVWRSRGHFG